MIKRKILQIAVFVSILLVQGCNHGGRASHEKSKSKKIVLIAGVKSHLAGYHEYIKTVRLLKTMLDHSNVKGIETEIHLNGWPEEASTLNTADLVLFITDGRDGHLYTDVPFMTAERMQVMENLMKRGCGFSLIHFSTFASDSIGESVLKWGGGYFDWQDENGERNWYSSITPTKALVVPNPASPVSRGLQAFQIEEEFYYNIRFNEQNETVVSAAEVPELKGRTPTGNRVAWTITRPDGGRGFSTTMGHYFSNWENPSFRKFILNGIVWAAGIEVPANGVESRFFSNREAIKHIYGKEAAALILTGRHHPSHDWKSTTPLIQHALESKNSIMTDVSTNIEDLSQYRLQDYDFLVLNYCNWNDSTGLGDASKKSFTNYLKKGGGLMIIHFANGAFHYSLPNAGASDWPEFRKICHLVWDHDSNSEHDNYGEFKVNVAGKSHPITRTMTDFVIVDELYFNQKGDTLLEPLLSAKSAVTGKMEPLAWAYTYGEGRIFQTLLGHAPESFKSAGMQELLQNASLWLIADKK